MDIPLHVQSRYDISPARTYNGLHHFASNTLCQAISRIRNLLTSSVRIHSVKLYYVLCAICFRIRLYICPASQHLTGFVRTVQPNICSIRFLSYIQDLNCYEIVCPFSLDTLNLSQYKSSENQAKSLFCVL